ncbi:MAG: glycosyltransferase family 2 protein [Lachnospiraceae bacterium]
MKILAGIILYNPDIERLKANVQSVYGQVQKVLCVDNDSTNIDMVQLQLGTNHSGHIDYILSESNRGVAWALNQMFVYAEKNGYDAVLTLDQDSVCQPELVKRYLHAAEKIGDFGILTCKIEDRNFGHDRLDDKQKRYCEKVNMCITSGALCSVKAYKATSGFDEIMFIDSVDFDYCIKIRKTGYGIYRLNYTGLLHEVGHGKKVRVLWRDFFVFNHNPMRHYYMSRNDIYLARVHGKYNPMWRVMIREFRDFVFVLLYEENKADKIKARLKGIRDGFCMKMN